MSKSGHHHMGNVEQTYKWLSIFLKLTAPLKEPPSKQSTKYPWKIQETIGIFITATAFLTIIIWFINIDQCTDTIYPTKNDSVINVTAIPAIAWYTKILWWMPANRKITCSNGFRNYECNVFHRTTEPNDTKAYLFYVDDIERFPLPRDPDTIWGLLNDESPLDRAMLTYENALNLFNFSATFSRFSDVPIPLTTLRGVEAITTPMYFVKTSMKNSLLSEFAPVIYLQSNCLTSTERDVYVEKLMEYIQVDSYGSCLRNKQLPLHEMYVNSIPRWTYTYRFHLYGEELMKFIAQYKFIVAIENAVCNDYMTEKFWRAIEVGTVPIYFGSPLIRDWLPNNKSAILLEDFPTPELLSQHLHYLLQNDTAYEEYLEHKTLGLISNLRILDELSVRPYQTDFEAVVKEFECFVCKKIHDVDSRRVNIMTKRQYDCPLPTSALTLSANPENLLLEATEDTKSLVDQIYQEIRNPDRTPRISNTSWKSLF